MSRTSASAHPLTILLRGHQVLVSDLPRLRRALAAGICQACGRDVGRLQLDHDHACCPGRVSICGECIRGTVCPPCNRQVSGIERGELARAFFEARDGTLHYQKLINYLGLSSDQAAQLCGYSTARSMPRPSGNWRHSRKVSLSLREDQRLALRRCAMTLGTSGSVILRVLIDTAEAVASAVLDELGPEMVLQAKAAAAHAGTLVPGGTLALEERQYEALGRMARAVGAPVSVVIRVLLAFLQDHPELLDDLRPAIAAETAALRKRKG